MRYAAVLFDVGETLIGPRDSFGAIYARVFRGLGVDLPPERFKRAIRRTLAELEHEIPSGEDRYGFFAGGEDEYWLRFATTSLAQAGGPASAPVLVRRAVDRLRDFFATPEAWRVYPDAIPVLRALRSDGVRLGVVSNWDSRLPGVLEMLELAEHFDAVGVSHLEGIEKPAPDFFRRILERLGVPPEQAIHVGDVPELDLAGARAAGIDGLLIDRHGRLDGTHATVSDLGDLPRIVRGARRLES
jgi:putative hydrolase of the HAD superfamily